MSQKENNKIIKRELGLIEKWSRAHIKEKYPQVQREDFKDLEHGLWVLKISKKDFKQPYLTTNQISSIVIEIFDLVCSPLTLTRAFAKAGGSNRVKKPIISQKEGAEIFYKIANPGEKHLESLEGQGLLKIIYLEPNSHRDSRGKFKDLVGRLKGKELKICDPYYGVNTLDALEEIIRSGYRVKFLSSIINEKVSKFNREFFYFKKHYLNKIEFRVYPKRELHDRYILSDNAFIIVGQGIKDLGNKESLILVVDDRFGKDIRKSLEKSFWDKWQDRNTTIL
ncbi:MAG: hypothetical protein Q8N88_05080 [Nanoarchaeota archaeon]|nr:hypothetical protein [Nanoarchaeota archaeon]